MMEGMKMATQGMMAMEQQQAVIATNLANVGTAGYRKEVMDVGAFSQVLERQMKSASPVSLPGTAKGGFLQVGGGMDVQGMLYTTTRTSYAQGALKMTGNPFDMALDDNGKGFFTTQGPDGIRFTRNGSFRLSTDGFLVTQDGSRVLGQKGPIRLEGKNFEVNDRGVITIEGKEVDRFLITEFTDKSGITKEGENKFAASEGFRISNDFSVKQGYMEMANVNAVKEMVDMMQTVKAYEASSKVLQAQDQALKKTVSEVGRTGS